MLQVHTEPIATGQRRLVRVGPLTFGGPRPVVIAGPCAVEPDYLDTARQLAVRGAPMLRGGAFKPRTRPDSFQGLGKAGLTLLAQARQLTGLPAVTEVLTPEDVPLVAAHVDCLQIGSRNMQNFRLLTAAGASGLPVLLKRGIAATYDEWLAAADYILETGNGNILLCERGVRSFEPRIRYMLDLSAVVAMRELTDLPILVDPSHAAGRAAWVPGLAEAALAAGADGLLVEAHPRPAESWCDAPQAIDLDTLGGILETARRHAKVTAQTVS
jgi:3-deoxy-7-phosphoheptulonate synthase